MKKNFKKILAFWLCAIVLAAAVPSGQEIVLAAAKINKNSVTLSVNQKTTLKVSGTTKKPVWSSNRTNIATVTSEGVVTAKKTGTATITAKIGKNKYNCKVTVKGNYRSLYKAFLAQKPSSIWYHVKDLNKDGLVDLITMTRQSKKIIFRVYTIHEGKVIFAGECATNDTDMYPPHYFYVDRYKGIYTSGWVNQGQGAYSQLYRMSGNKLIRKAYARQILGNPGTFHTGTSPSSLKQVSRSEYVCYCDNYFGDYKLYHMKVNNVANRSTSFS